METSFREIGFFSWLYSLCHKLLFIMIPFSDNTRVVFQENNSLKKDKQYIYSLHPHGLIAQGRILHITKSNSTLFPYFHNSYQGIHSTIFRIPLLRELLLFFRCVPAHEHFLKEFIHQGHSISLYPGGAREIRYCSDLTDPNIDYFYVKKRKGIIRIAKDTSVPLVPVIFWNDQERFTYTHTNIGKRINKLLKIITGYSLDINILQVLSFSNLKTFWNMCFGQEEHIVYIGKPIQIDVDETIEDGHIRYMEAIRELYMFAKEDQKSNRELILT